MIRLHLIYSYKFTGPYKVKLPDSILQELFSNSQTPFIFKLTSSKKSIYSGVQEFSAPNHEIGLSSDLADDLEIEIGEKVAIELVNLPKGSSLTLKHDTVDNVDFTSLLEFFLPKCYSALSIGMTLKIPYLGKTYNLLVLSLEPNDAVCILDCDLKFELVSDQVPNIEVKKPNIIFNKELDVIESMTLTVNTPPVDKLYFSSKSLAYIGPMHATSDTSFIAVADSQPIEVDTSLLGEKFQVLVSNTFKILTEVQPGNCEYCGHFIPEQNLTLHITFCSRNSIECECGSKFLNEIPSSHVKLHEIKASLGVKCECGFDPASFLDLAYHRALKCPNRLHECRFCHLLVPVEKSNPVFQVEGFSTHEGHCGLRSTNCHICQRYIRLRNLDLHIKEHEIEKHNRKPPPMCSNRECPNILEADSKMPYKLCSHCFGPSSVPGDNLDQANVRSRLERRLVLQMITGCKRTWCQNQFCLFGSGGRHKWTPAEALEIAKKLLKENKLHFCVDEISTRRQMFVALDNGFDRAWRCFAIGVCASEQEATEWLEKNVTKIKN